MTPLFLEGWSFETTFAEEMTFLYLFQLFCAICAGLLFLAAYVLALALGETVEHAQKKKPLQGLIIFWIVQLTYFAAGFVLHEDGFLWLWAFCAWLPAVYFPFRRRFDHVVAAQNPSEK